VPSLRVTETASESMGIGGLPRHRPRTSSYSAVGRSIEGRARDPSSASHGRTRPIRQTNGLVGPESAGRRTTAGRHVPASVRPSGPREAQKVQNGRSQGASVELR
jgi:hypothetical protein